MASRRVAPPLLDLRQLPTHDSEGLALRKGPGLRPPCPMAGNIDPWRHRAVDKWEKAGPSLIKCDPMIMHGHDDKPSST